MAARLRAMSEGIPPIPLIAGGFPDPIVFASLSAPPRPGMPMVCSVDVGVPTPVASPFPAPAGGIDFAALSSSAWVWGAWGGCLPAPSPWVKAFFRA